ncbi:3-oxoadipate enol-lactonase [Hoyosella sp. YIM 151337]|uniref:3-oxoadipate enol-lactonase n=1 Tax=Hoyosella sp. YIM 151337 TaxID=2992742 RepID=UPI002235A528|nr:3-oxoadipate enol-lactonase [Hoyosella sp. YIM 151337]MCW4354350.1 3-oxoadipate enol-lactonase [Hoyosella sp. YIM 151337]
MSVAVRVNWVSDGPDDGAIVLFSGSLGSDVRMWEPQVTALTDAGYRVIRYDHRGHGGSPVPRGPYSLDDLGGDVLELLNLLNARRVHFAGLSLGGMVGMWLAENSPERLSTLTLCCTSADLGPASGWAERAALVRKQGTQAVAEAVVSRWFTPGWAEANPGRITFFREMVAAIPAEGYASCCTAIEQMDILDRLETIPTPTLVIAGAEDPATPPYHGKLIAETVQQGRLAIVSPGAHLASAERPGEVNQLILEHIRSAHG